MKIPAFCLYLAFALFGAMGLVRGQGVAILKNQVYHRDSTATALAYSEIIDSRGPYLRLVMGEESVNVFRSKLVDRIEVPRTIPENIEKEADVSDLRTAEQELGAFAKKYQNSVPLLEGTIKAIGAHIAKFDGGQIRFEENWMSKERKAEILAERKVVADADELVEIEKRVFAAAQRDKGLILYRGRWMTREQIEQLPATSATELSDSIAPLMNGDLTGAKFSVENLNRLAAKQTGEPKVRTQRLSSLVRNLFRAETRLVNQTIVGEGLAYQASKREKNADEWMKPNFFGTVNKNAAEEARKEAKSISARRAEELADCRRELMAQLKQSDRVVEDFHKLKELRVVLILDMAVRRVAARHFSKEEFTPVIPDWILAGIREEIQQSVAAEE